ncbi:hypothetical protein OPV22_024519 [Ensete ventricosum]|uniref:Uncharacterized protein n=1 Tax=Ensete ventricosum TaxID=4639 RepID=A0AAV8P6G4_ENSVE|nr:hypothetical protein OPV22_024519 [Ensete ventricosum]
MVLMASASYLDASDIIEAAHRIGGYIGPKRFLMSRTTGMRIHQGPDEFACGSAGCWLQNYLPAQIFSSFLAQEVMVSHHIYLSRFGCFLALLPNLLKN